MLIKANSTLVLIHILKSDGVHYVIEAKVKLGDPVFWIHHKRLVSTGFKAVGNFVSDISSSVRLTAKFSRLVIELDNFPAVLGRSKSNQILAKA